MSKPHVTNVDGFVSIERRLHRSDDWMELIRFQPGIAIDQARAHMERIEPVVPTAEHQLVYTRIETTKEVLD